MEIDGKWEAICFRFFLHDMFSEMWQKYMFKDLKSISWPSVYDSCWIMTLADNIKKHI